jgi:undecaprenyl-diphosphatase
MNAMAASVMLLSCHNRWGLPLLGWSLVIGISRVICGLHYVSDVAGGFIMGIGSAFFIKHNAVAKNVVGRIAWEVHVVSEFLQVWWKKC